MRQPWLFLFIFGTTLIFWKCGFFQISRQMRILFYFTMMDHKEWIINKTFKTEDQWMQETRPKSQIMKGSENLRHLWPITLLITIYCWWLQKQICSWLYRLFVFHCKALIGNYDLQLHKLHERLSAVILRLCRLYVSEKEALLWCLLNVNPVKLLLLFINIKGYIQKCHDSLIRMRMKCSNTG